jgi:hypothetical protein
LRDVGKEAADRFQPRRGAEERRESQCGHGTSLLEAFGGNIGWYISGIIYTYRMTAMFMLHSNIVKKTTRIYRALQAGAFPNRHHGPGADPCLVGVPRLGTASRRRAAHACPTLVLVDGTFVLPLGG